MSKINIPELIIKKFLESTEKDSALKSISGELADLVRKGKATKASIEKLLKEEKNETAPAAGQ